jgi:LEA14-like dessication related protein
MRTIVLWICLVFSVPLLAGDGGLKEPSFVGFENMKVAAVTVSNITIVADMVLNNPNSFKVYLKNLNVEVFTENDVKLTEIEQGMKVEMPPAKDFKMPVVLNVSPAKLIESSGGVFNSMLSALKEREITLKYKGSWKVEIKKITIKVPIRYKETMVF